MNPEKLQQDFDAVRTELQVCKQKMNSKCEALLILTKDLDQCRQERDQFKLMAEQVQARYQSIKRQLAGVGPRASSLEGVPYSDMKNQSLAHLLCEMRDVNKSLQFEVDDLKQKLRDANGDIKLLREQIARHRVGTTDEGMDTRHFPAHEREDLVHKLETSGDQLNQMERDLQQLLDEKEELVTERDVYRNKYDRLNKELNYILKGDEKRVLDIDNLVMENRYLQERIRQVEDEKVMAMATISKYKTILDRKKNKGILKLGQNRSGGLVISQKQVHQLLDNPMTLSPTPQMMADLQSLASALLETLNDKNVALSHQRKTNKILGARVSELENKLKTLEIAGLWNFPDKCLGLEKLKMDCEEIKLLFPSSSSSTEAQSSKAEDNQQKTIEQQSDSDSENKDLGSFADGVCQNLVDLDQSSSAISPSHTDRSSCMNSDTEATSTTAGAEHIIATFLGSSCLHHEAKEDLSGLLLTGAVGGDHDGVEDTIRIDAETESKKTPRNVSEQHGSATTDPLVVENINTDDNNRLRSHCSEEFVSSVLNENSSSTEISADGCGEGNSTDDQLLMTS